jgi:hypothetical protein
VWPPRTSFCCLRLSLHRALWNRYIVHSPTNALFIRLGKI